MSRKRLEDLANDLGVSKYRLEIIVKNIEVEYKGAEEVDLKYKYMDFMKNIIDECIGYEAYVELPKGLDSYYDVLHYLNSSPMRGNVIIGNELTGYFTENDYRDKVLKSPTWLDICKIAEKNIVKSQDEDHCYVESIYLCKYVYIFGKNVACCELFMGS